MFLNVAVSSNGSAGNVSASTEAMAKTNLPDEPLDPKNAPTPPLLPADMVTSVPSSTIREAMTAHAAEDHPPGPPMLAVITSACDC